MTGTARMARINRMRENTAVRARLQASRELAHAETLLAVAQEHRQQSEKRRLTAEATLTTNPADDHALLWRRITAEAVLDARDREAEARDRHAKAHRLLAAARVEHERRGHQRGILEARLAHERLVVRNRRDDSATDEHASGNLSSGCTLQQGDDA